MIYLVIFGWGMRTKDGDELTMESGYNRNSATESIGNAKLLRNSTLNKRNPRESALNGAGDASYQTLRTSWRKEEEK